MYVHIMYEHARRTRACKMTKLTRARARAHCKVMFALPIRCDCVQTGNILLTYVLKPNQPPTFLPGALHCLCRRTRSSAK